MTWKIEFARPVLKDLRKIKAANLSQNLNDLVVVLKENPFSPPYEKLSGNLRGYYSRRINIKHRLVYSVDTDSRVIRVISIWSHYE